MLFRYIRAMSLEGPIIDGLKLIEARESMRR